MFYVIGNVYLGKGFTWVENDVTYPSDSWKYSKHGQFETKEEAIKASEELNKIYS